MTQNSVEEKKIRRYNQLEKEVLLLIKKGVKFFGGNLKNLLLLKDLEEEAK